MQNPLEARTARAVQERKIDVFYSEEDEGYIARQANAHGISAVGDTPEEALAELRKVFALIDEDQDEVPFSWVGA